MEFQFDREIFICHDPLPLCRFHFVDMGKSHVIPYSRDNGFDDGIGVMQTLEDDFRHIRTDCFVSVKMGDAVFDGSGGRFSHIMQQD